MDPEQLMAALEALRAMRPAMGRRRGLPQVVVIDDHDVRRHTRAGREELAAESDSDLAGDLGVADPMEMVAKEAATLDKREYEDTLGIDSDELGPRRGETYPGQYYPRRR